MERAASCVCVLCISGRSRSSTRDAECLESIPTRATVIKLRILGVSNAMDGELKYVHVVWIRYAL
ncbi:hypothetical protein B0F87_109122 [Methylobacter tundripaludum]|uniref:Uncharacterized protein n=1 Tax=Methylobacter tundripaludum TaxID=173365 RepID=A0A2S6HAM1_9GAMM|nr:hypothetical protein B0F87_109122 [Methylobacter tundripaludum]